MQTPGNARFVGNSSPNPNTPYTPLDVEVPSPSLDFRPGSASPTGADAWSRWRRESLSAPDLHSRRQSHGARSVGSISSQPDAYATQQQQAMDMVGLKWQARQAIDRALRRLSPPYPAAAHQPQLVEGQSTFGPLTSHPYNGYPSPLNGSLDGHHSARSQASTPRVSSHFARAVRFVSPEPSTEGPRPQRTHSPPMPAPHIGPIPEFDPPTTESQAEFARTRSAEAVETSHSGHGPNISCTQQTHAGYPQHAPRSTISTEPQPTYASYLQHAPASYTRSKPTLSQVEPQPTYASALQHTPSTLTHPPITPSPAPPQPTYASALQHGLIAPNPNPPVPLQPPPTPAAHPSHNAATTALLAAYHLVRTREKQLQETHLRSLRTQHLATLLLTTLLWTSLLAAFTYWCVTSGNRPIPFECLELGARLNATGTLRAELLDALRQRDLCVLRPGDPTMGLWAGGLGWRLVVVLPCVGASFVVRGVVEGVLERGVRRGGVVGVVARGVRGAAGVIAAVAGSCVVLWWMGQVVYFRVGRGTGYKG